MVAEALGADIRGADTFGAPVVIYRDRWIPEELWAKYKTWTPRTGLGVAVREALHYLPGPLAAELIDRLSSVVVIESSLRLRIIRPNRNGHPWDVLIEDLGVVGRKSITTAGVNFLVDAFQGTTEMENLKYHGIGTGSTAEAVGDTALVTELTTEYTGNVRATGTLAEGASANIFRTVGSNLLDATPGAALREHGIFSQAATGGGTLWDRTVYSAITLSSGDTLESTYDMTASSGG